MGKCMDKPIKLILTKKLLELCNCKPSYRIYALLPEINGGDYFYEVDSPLYYRSQEI